MKEHKVNQMKLGSVRQNAMTHEKIEKIKQKTEMNQKGETTKQNKRKSGAKET